MYRSRTGSRLLYAGHTFVMPIFDAICALVIFLSAFLLFLVEPMTAKRLLPALGGSAAVWTTCLVFFQTALLAGYLYAHLLATRLRRRAQGWVHSAVLAAALTGLLVGIQPESAAASWHPLATTLWLLTALIGLPFLALAATTPLVQSWYLDGRGGAAPPWRLFALSNLGSLLALAVYPALIEPYLALRTQRLAWGAGFAIFAVACAALAWGWRGTAGMAYGDGSSSVVSHPRDGNKSRGWGTETSATPGHSSPTSSTAPTGARDAVAPLGRRALWVLLPAAGSLMLCDMTSHLSQNVAAIPLLWIVPLAAYLLSFIVTFAGPRWYARSYALRALAMAVGAIGYLLLDPDRSLPLVISIPVFTGALFVFCYFCHGELYRLRPDARQTTSFYLLLSLGSALGAIAAGVIAPALFRANYDLALGLIVLVALAVAATWKTGIAARLFWSGAACALIAVAAVSIRALDRHSIAQLRSFYGSLRVTETFAVPNIGIERTLYHGTIEHGIQIFNDELRMQPTSYYAADSGVGLALRLCCGGRMRRIGAVGLGVGTIAAYGQAGDVLNFYEIDPLVERLARARFTYLRESRAQVSVVLGDARLSLEREVPQIYDVLVLDAFSGDAVPVHLLTTQSMAVYRRHLRAGGVLAFHISSQYVNLAPELAAQARAAGMTAAYVHSNGNDALGEFPADWVLMSADSAWFKQSEMVAAAQPLIADGHTALWTDDFNSLLPLIQWTGLKSASVSGR